MTEPTENSVRQLLLDAVPPMTDPPDRVAAVKAMAGRSVRRRGGVIACAIAVLAVAVGVPALRSGTRPDPAAPTPVGEECPAGWDALGQLSPLTPDEPGLLVPPDGALTVSLCKRTGRVSNSADPPEPRVVAMTLATRASDMVAALNSLPSGPMPRVCTDVGFPPTPLVVRYADRPPVIVEVDRNCGLVGAGGHLRVLSDGLFDEFYTLYRQQLVDVTDPATLPDPVCAEHAATQYDDVGPMTGVIADEIVRNVFGQDPLLPSPLVSVAACRYEARGNQLDLVASRRTRDGLDAARDLLNDATSTRSVAECSVGFDPVTYDRIDVIWLVDATGRTAEVRVLRSPCETLYAVGTTSRVPLTGLLAWLDQMLG
jgi:hypothetical protein